MEASSSSMSITTTATRSRSSQWSTIWPNTATGKEALSFDLREPHHRLVRSRTPSPRSLTPILISTCSATSPASIIKVPAMSLAVLIYDMAIFPNRQSAYPSGLCSEMITRTVTSDFLKNTGGSQLCGPQVCELPIFCVHWVPPRRSLPRRPCVQTLAQERFPLIEARSAVAAVRARIPGIIRKTYSAPITALLISFRYFSVRPLMYFCVFCAALVSTPTSLYISVNPWFCSV